MHHDQFLITGLEQWKGILAKDSQKTNDFYDKYSDSPLGYRYCTKQEDYVNQQVHSITSFELQRRHFKKFLIKKLRFQNIRKAAMTENM